MAIILFFYLGIISLTTEDSTWTKSLTGRFNYNQVAFENWVKGGEDAYAWQFIIEYKFIKEAETYNWNTNGKFSYGQTELSESGIRKTNDEIIFESVYTHKIGFAINPYASFGLKTQFDKAYDYKSTPVSVVSDFADPLYTNQTIGLGYHYNEIFKSRLGFSFNQTSTNKYSQYSDDLSTTVIEDFKNEIGARLNIDYSDFLSEKIKWNSKLEVFSTLKEIKKTDLFWNNTLHSDLSDIITVSFDFSFIYDFDLSSSRQLKRVLSLGISYNLL
jgi:hypothetical protein